MSLEQNSTVEFSYRQVLVIFDNSVKKSKASTNLQKRIINILDYLTKSLWKYTNRSLYEKHKFLFTLLLALKIDMNIGNISFSEFSILLKGGALLDLNSVKVSLCLLSASQLKPSLSPNPSSGCWTWCGSTWWS